MADQLPPPLMADSGSTAVCVECGKTFNEGDMIRHGNVSICANCKPIFMQKLAEGARIDPNAMTYANRRRRSLAFVIDRIILSIFNACVGAVFGVSAVVAASGQRPDPVAALKAQMPILLISSLMWIAYETFFIGKFGATPGKMVCKVKVVTPDGGPVSYMRAFGRCFAKILSGLILGIGFLMAFFDGEKRALHDRICSTRVIYTGQ